MDRQRVYKKTIEKYGEDMQLMIAVEELAELQKEIIKWIRFGMRRDCIIEEIADVEIMIEQTIMMLNIKVTDIEHIKDCKIKRLSNKFNMEG